MAIDPTTQIGRMRLLTGDVQEEPFFDDNIYQHQLDEGNGELGGAINVLDSIINAMALLPERERAGRIEVYKLDMNFLYKRLKELKLKRLETKGAPVLMNAGQKDWDWLDNLFDA